MTNFSNDSGTGVVIADGFQLADGTPIGGVTTYTVKAQSIGQNVVTVPITFLSNTEISIFTVTARAKWTGAVNPVSAASQGSYLYAPLSGQVIQTSQLGGEGNALFDFPFSVNAPISNGLAQEMGSLSNAYIGAGIVGPYISNNQVSTELTFFVAAAPFDVVTYDWITGNSVTTVNTIAQIDYTIEVLVQ